MFSLLLFLLRVVTAGTVVASSRLIFEGKHGPYCQSCAKKLGNMTLAFCFLSPRNPGPIERPPKPEYLIALASYLGVRW